ncbi:UDP-3-O-(3-hydroxymyristoyl)glucosamine N-acyltransferase [Ramlibacter ginsenosidimutans]|uniref:UDP-3-O-acylglucosamine N-acyltransferase n=1 Tax=Ramlibacter ginsenosidimutans TaxID=502333 RepID=A0A934WMS8_9BURK|nr:UDP-3-O-(3-hydroxymyristoyl)glucosamine N-acyltransferase [Ramlibacter ginsenosidimutans]
MALTLGEIVAAIPGELHGDPAVAIEGLAPLESAGPGQLAFLSNPRYRPQLAASRAACVIVGPAVRDAAVARGACIVAEDPYAYFARVTQLWKRTQGRPAPGGIHPSAVIDPEAVLGEGVAIGPHCVVERGARIGAGTVLKARVHVAEDCSIGARCILHPGVVIGADGFGFAPTAEGMVKIEQLGAVRIGDDVEIGANSCIDRGALADTVIEDGVKIDNLVQIGHNCRVGRHTVISGCTGVAGSATIGAHCMIGGAAMILGHITIGDRVHISGGTFVSKSISKPGLYTAIFPIDDNASWEKNAATLRQLHTLRERIKALEKKL